MSLVPFDEPLISSQGRVIGEARRGISVAIVIERPLGSVERARAMAGLDDPGGFGPARDQPVAQQKEVRLDGRARRELGDDQSAPLDDPVNEAAVFGRVDVVERTSENGDRGKAGAQGCFVGRGIDTQSQARKDDEPRTLECPHASANQVQRTRLRLTRADDRESQLGQPAKELERMRPAADKELARNVLADQARRRRQGRIIAQDFGWVPGGGRAFSQGAEVESQDVLRRMNESHEEEGLCIGRARNTALAGYFGIANRTGCPVAGVRKG